MHCDLPSVSNLLIDADPELAVLLQHLVPAVWKTTPRNSTQDKNGYGKLNRCVAVPLHGTSIACVSCACVCAVTTWTSRPHS